MAGFGAKQGNFGAIEKTLPEALKALISKR
jgi:hypothetical protein